MTKTKLLPIRIPPDVLALIDAAAKRSESRTEYVVAALVACAAEDLIRHEGGLTAAERDTIARVLGLGELERMERQP
jgi:uncharacterized protein (DUF1778 family)